MRAFLAALAAVVGLSFVPADLPEVDGGIGFILVAEFDQTLAFYEAPTDSAPVVSVPLLGDEPPQMPAGFLPDVWWPDYHLISFRVREARDDGWARVVVHEETGRELWLRTDPDVLPFVAWERFLTEHLTVAERLDPASNPLRTAPGATAPLAPTPSGIAAEGWATDCFLPVEVRGEWARVVPSGLCARDLPEAPRSLGWIRWRDGARLLLSYGVTC